MDIHTLEGEVSTDDVAKAYAADLEIQDKYGVKYHRYWVDEAAGKIFCLVEAPDAEAANTVHRESHGLVAEWLDGEAYRFRSRKSWALFTYLLLSERAPARHQLAGLLFADADDPLRALRWSLAEIRRELGAEGTLEGDPVTLQLPCGTRVDAQVILDGKWSDSVQEVGLGCELLDGLEIRGHQPSGPGCCRRGGGWPRRPRPAGREPSGVADPALPRRRGRRYRSTVVRRLRSDA